MIDLDAVRTNSAWLRYKEPFPHIMVRDVFVASFYDQLCRRIQGILEQGLFETPTPGKLSRMGKYDAYGFGWNYDPEDPLSLFLSPGWRDLMCGLYGQERMPYVSAGAHYHPVGSKPGAVHADFTLCWFPRSPTGDMDDMRTPRDELVDYKTGEGPLDPEQKLQVVRGTVMIYYLMNDGWQWGDGGVTGLWKAPCAPGDRPAKRCPPINNSLIAYECTPRSLHAFRSNIRLPRTSIIMWVHRSVAEAEAKFGKGNFEPWKL